MLVEDGEVKAFNLVVRPFVFCFFNDFLWGGFYEFSIKFS